MNWIGGARNRVKFNGEQSIQQEFFQKKRLAPKITAAKLSFQKKPRLSQDLLALNSISRAHSRLYAGQSCSKPIKSVDLGKYRSCTQQINEVDMGPSSPGQRPSRLLLNEGKMEQNQSSWSARKRYDSHSSHKPATGQDAPKKLHRPKRELDSHRDSGFIFSDSSAFGFSKESFITRDRDTENNQSKAQGDQKTRRPHHASPTVNPSSDHSASQSSINYNKVMNAYQKGSCLHPSGPPKYDNAFISEDFQATPLVNYDLVKSKSKDKHRHRHKSKSRSHISDQTIDETFGDRHKSKSRTHISDQTINETLGSGFKDVPFQFSSTPLCSTVNEGYSHRDRLSSDHNSKIQLSPIMKMPLCDKSKFIYKSRPTATVTSVDENGSNRLHESQSGTCGHLNTSTRPHYRDPNPCSQGRFNSSGHSSVFDKLSPLSSSINSFDHSFQKKDFVTPRQSGRHVPRCTTDDSVSTHRTSTQQTSSHSSLINFRRYDINHSFSGSEKFNSSLSAAGIEKPVFSDSDDDDIVYKPHKLSGPKRAYERQCQTESNILVPTCDTSAEQLQRKKIKKEQEDFKDNQINETNSHGISSNQDLYHFENITERCSLFAPLASNQMEVLNEISRLEQEDTEIQDTTISQPLQKEAPNSMCDEADMFIQSEAHQMTELEKEMEDTSTVKVTGDASDESHKDKYTNRNNGTDQSNNKSLCDKTMDKTCDMQHMKVDSQSDELKEADEFDISGDTIKSQRDTAIHEIHEHNKQHTKHFDEINMINETCENYKKATGQSSEVDVNNETAENNKQNTKQKSEVSMLHEATVDPKICATQNSESINALNQTLENYKQHTGKYSEVTDNYKQHTRQNNEVNGVTKTNKSQTLQNIAENAQNKAESYKQHTGKNREANEVAEKYKRHTGDYSEVVVQVADVSSGKNQATQTVDSVESVNRSTSPLQGCTSSVSVGVQWDRRDLNTDVPRLVQLALQVLTTINQ